MPQPFSLLHKMKRKGTKLSRSQTNGQDNSPRQQETPQKQNRGHFLKSAQAKMVDTKDLSPDDFIIAVMGPTGSGKSTFISHATGYDAGIGHNLESCTTEIDLIKLSFPGMSAFNLVFIDTPGFDDTNKSDTEILEMISSWLSKTYKRRILLSGLLYLHRITDNRMAGAPLKNLHMFEGLCGKNMLRNIILTTTMWEDEDVADGSKREEELKENYWKSMIAHGSVTRRFEKQTQAAAFKVLEPLLDGAVQRNSLLIQKEMVDLGQQLSATTAGQTLFLELKRILAAQEEVLRRMRTEMQSDVEDAQALMTIKNEYEELKKNFDFVHSQVRELKLPIGRRLLKTFGSAFHFNFRHRQA